MNRTAAAAIAAQYAKATVSGTDGVSWDEGVHCYLPKAVFCGKCAQQTYTGKNLFDKGLGADYVIWRETTYTRTANGFIITRTTDSAPGYGMYISFHLPLPSFDVIRGKSVTVSFDIANSSVGANPLVRFGYWNTASLWKDFGNMTPHEGHNSFTVSVPAATPADMTDVTATGLKGVHFFINVQIEAGTGKNAITLSNVQVEIGGSETAYEPYVGGAPSPSISYPQPIKVNNGKWADGGDGTVDLSVLGGLYSVPGTDYADEWDSQSGRGVRRCGVIASYTDQPITTPYISTTGALTRGATVVYGIPDAAFTASPQKLVEGNGAGELYRYAGDVAGCPAEVCYVRRSGS